MLAACLFLYKNSIAQDKYKAIDDYVLKLGKLDSLTMGTISSIVTKPFTDKQDKARAIYTWIANNISYDVKSARVGNTNKNSPTEVLLYRKAVGIGFASLFQDMCSSADIRCLTADGYLKNNAASIGEQDMEINHSWAVVQLGKSPTEWFYADPALASGDTDPDMKAFTPKFSGGYFFSDKKIFNWQHFPDNEAWKLGEAPKTKKDFFALPVIKAGAYDVSLSKFSPATGIIRTSNTKNVQFSFSLANAGEVSKVELIYGEPRKLRTKSIPFSLSSGDLVFSNKFETEGEYPLLIKVDGKELISYKIISEGE